MSSTSQNKQIRKNVSFNAIDPYIETAIISPTEKRLSGRDMIEWGDGNAYPDYLLELYKNVPTLATIINGNIDFITGDDMVILPLTGEYTDGEMNTRGDIIRDQVKEVAKDIEIYGGFALQVIRNRMGEVAEVYYIDMRFLRSNKENDVFYYCENWNKRGSKDVIVYPAFNPNLDWMVLDEDARNRNASSILFVKDVHTQTYPAPRYAPAVKDCEIERCVTDFHLNSVNNGFVSSLIVNFNNGIPDEKIQEEIEDDFNDKFSGHQNAGRIMFSWNKNKESATEIVEPKIEDFGERYKALSTHCRQQIFASFRAIPALFGIMTESTGFNSQEFGEAFKLYNRTQIRPVQRMICDAYDKIYGQKGVLTIKPFSIEAETETNVN